MVENKLCVLHIYRNIGANVKMIAQKKSTYGSVKRNLVRESGLKMELIKVAVEEIDKLLVNFEQKVRLLRADELSLITLLGITLGAKLTISSVLDHLQVKKITSLNLKN